MINIGTYIMGSLKKNWYVIFLIMVILFGIHLANVFIKNKKQIEEYQRIEAIVNTQNENTKENVKIIKKRNINNSIADREQLLEKMFSE